MLRSFNTSMTFYRTVEADTLIHKYLFNSKSPYNIIRHARCYIDEYTYRIEYNADKKCLIETVLKGIKNRNIVKVGIFKQSNEIYASADNLQLEIEILN